MGANMEDLKTQEEAARRYREYRQSVIASYSSAPRFKPSRKYQFKESVSLLALACHGRL